MNECGCPTADKLLASGESRYGAISCLVWIWIFLLSVCVTAGPGSGGVTGFDAGYCRIREWSLSDDAVLQAPSYKASTGQRGSIMLTSIVLAAQPMECNAYQMKADGTRKPYAKERDVRRLVRSDRERRLTGGLNSSSSLSVLFPVLVTAHPWEERMHSELPGVDRVWSRGDREWGLPDQQK